MEGLLSLAIQLVSLEAREEFTSSFPPSENPEAEISSWLKFSLPTVIILRRHYFPPTSPDVNILSLFELEDGPVWVSWLRTDIIDRQ